MSETPADPQGVDAPQTERAWRLVPVEPTPEMLANGRDALDAARENGGRIVRSTWAAMLAAAPPPPAAGVDLSFLEALEEAARKEWRSDVAIGLNRHVVCVAPDAILSLRPAIEAAIASAVSEAEGVEERRLQDAEAADNLRLLDYIADKIGLPDDVELAGDNFSSFLSALESERDALKAEVARLREALTDEAVGAAMLEGWNEICSDTNCHPLDVTQEGRRRLSFSPSHWAAHTAMYLREDAKRFADTTFMLAGGGYIAGDLDLNDKQKMEAEATAVYAQLNETPPLGVPPRSRGVPR